jgi:hypothetical protein
MQIAQLCTGRSWPTVPGGREAKPEFLLMHLSVGTRKEGNPGDAPLPLPLPKRMPPGLTKLSGPKKQEVNSCSLNKKSCL